MLERAVARAQLVSLLSLSSLVALPSAQAGEWDGELALDFLRAQSSNDGSGAGAPVDMDSQDIGIRLLVSGQHNRLSVLLDYYGRQPVRGEIQNSELHLLYSGYVRYAVAPKRLDATVGRFLAPSVVFMPVDAVSLALHGRQWSASAFAGRRAILTSRRNVPLDDFLPAGGASATWGIAWLKADGVLAFSADEAILLNATDEVRRRYESWNGYVNAWLQPLENLTIVARVSGAERVGYVMGPTWTSAELDVGTFDLWSSSALVEWRALRRLRLSYDLHTQRAGVYRVGLVQGTGDRAIFLRDPPQEPRFTDHRMRATLVGLARGRLRGEVRLRQRPEWRETRYSGSFDFNHLGIGRLGLRGRFFYDHIDPAPGFKSAFVDDRHFYSGALAYPFAGADLELGASRIERQPPYSGRTFRPDEPHAPPTPEDLGLFTLQTETIAFARFFYTRGLHFGGVDLELNLEDTHELRFFVQLGTRWEHRR